MHLYFSMEVKYQDYGNGFNEFAIDASLKYAMKLKFIVHFAEIW
ncbi:hypothetical protein [Campylobacter sp. CCUG 57310]|nr:hypothetical protein [Campylobacter sp. CCUG 57310]